MENTALNPDRASPEHGLWAAVIGSAIQDATKKVSEPDWSVEWRVKDYQRKVVVRNQARGFFHNGSCTNILKAMGVEPGWFYGKLKSRHPEIFTHA